MPHFYAIAIYRQNDYAAANIPVLPIRKGIPATQIQMLLYIIAFTGVSLFIALWCDLGIPYLITAFLGGIAWTILCLKGFQLTDFVSWARKMFILSLVIITSLCIAILFG